MRHANPTHKDKVSIVTIHIEPITDAANIVAQHCFKVMKIATLPLSGLDVSLIDQDGSEALSAMI
ncbi:hypothetical protein [Vibrio vulnificus]|uniref:hypothetical protein n=1 Tax=Vibrio vulnificus TaxID=672 RepID=UPI001EEA1158|nr:hypothetical protein [Vibrio vulnificus]